MKKHILILCVYLLSNISNACVCVERCTKEKDIEITDVILTAKVLSKEIFSKNDHEITGLRQTYLKYKVKIIAVQKGKITSKILTIATSQGDCGYNFEKGKTYIIYAGYHKENKRDKFLYTSICTRTSQFFLHEFNKLTTYCKYKGAIANS